MNQQQVVRCAVRNRLLGPGVSALLALLLAVTMTAPAVGAPTEQTLTQDGRGFGFGRAVAIDGRVLVVGAQGHTVSQPGGAAYVYTRERGRWVLDTILESPDPFGGEQFGSDVDVHGQHIIVGARADTDDRPRDGQAYVFRRRGHEWHHEGTLAAFGGASQHRFGQAVAIDGRTAVVGAGDGDDGGTGSGQAYVFTREGRDWVPSTVLTGDGSAPPDLFGRPISVDGHSFAVGAGGADGAVYVFERGPRRTWSQAARLTGADAGVAGLSGDLELDGNTLLVGAHVFVRDQTGWQHQQQLGSVDDGATVSVGLDGDVAVVGETRADLAAPDAGALHVWLRDGQSWVLEVSLTAASPAAGDLLALSAAVSGRTVVGASAAGGDGTVHVFDLGDRR